MKRLNLGTASIFIKFGWGKTAIGCPLLGNVTLDECHHCKGLVCVEVGGDGFTVCCKADGTMAKQRGVA